ncbi:MAG: Hsp20/alpha crystallin family protein [Parcubacteria group bacterium]|nr:Hsp20/alpha crystallin family protein [Parcubacteria group bacterium]
MPKNKPSFFERLTGTVDMSDEQVEDVYEDTHDEREIVKSSENDEWLSDEMTEEGELAVDVCQTADDIIIKAMIAGVDPSDIEVDITREMVTIRGERMESSESESDDYFFRELYWGSFSRSVVLPEEIEPEEAVAKEKNGLLTIRLPKVDREKISRVKVKAS